MSVVKSKRSKPKLRRMKKLVDVGVLTKEHVDKCLEAWKAHAKQGIPRRCKADVVFADIP